MTYINNFGDVGQGDVSVAGGKGVGLDGLIEAGVPVPPGFVLNTTAAYAAFEGPGGTTARTIART